MDLDEAARKFREFAEVIQKLRTPGTGCPWDLEQDHRSLRNFLIEEAYEVLDAIERSDDRALCEELGDLLLQVVLHAQVASDRGAFDITQVTEGIRAKMVHRHPHVFGPARVSGSAEVIRNWEQIKAAENEAKGIDPTPRATLERLPESLPALVRAQRLGEKAAKLNGFDSALGTDVEALRIKVAELSAALEAPGTARISDAAKSSLEADLGEVLFTLSQCARRFGLSAENALCAANRRFIERIQTR